MRRVITLSALFAASCTTDTPSTKIPESYACVTADAEAVAPSAIPEGATASAVDIAAAQSGAWTGTATLAEGGEVAFQLVVAADADDAVWSPRSLEEVAAARAFADGVAEAPEPQDTGTGLIELTAEPACASRWEIPANLVLTYDDGRISESVNTRLRAYGVDASWFSAEIPRSLVVGTDRPTSFDADTWQGVNLQIHGHRGAAAWDGDVTWEGSTAPAPAEEADMAVTFVSEVTSTWRTTAP
jgi:hypothetical protein